MSAPYTIFVTLFVVGLIAGMAGVAASEPTFSLCQYGASDDRDLCLQNCRDWISPYAWGFRFRGGYSSEQYALCVQDCESRFWRRFDQKMDQLKEF
jgi:hypothetical protein